MNNPPNKIKSLIKIRPIIALTGGAGPDAAIDLQMKLSCAMKEKLNISFDQEHYRVIIDNNTQIAYIDNIDSAVLGIDYDINNTIKYNKSVSKELTNLTFN